MAAAACGGNGAPAAAPHTWINPLDIEYRYVPQHRTRNISFREGADPVILRYGDQYFLFVTRSGGYWRSPDLAHWTFISPDQWPDDDMVAPAAWIDGDTMFIMQSAYGPRPLYRTTDPAAGRLVRMPALPAVPTAEPDGAQPPYHAGAIPPGPWDPALFRDARSGRWYLYWGSSNSYPVYGIELMKDGDRFSYVGSPVPLVHLDPAHHGWERFGFNHTDSTIAPYVEGAWMTAHAGRYYLQYAAPGTEFNAYANGTLIGDAPLGPFAYALNNPVSYRPGGFVIGAGHGNTFQDAFGNYWNTGTSWIGVNWRFERRIVMFPAAFDDDGLLHADTRFGDLPHYLPAGRWRSTDDLFTGWMLLSYRKHARASSALDSFPARRVTDENPRTFWVAATNRPGEWIELDLGGVRAVRALQVDFADYESGIYATDSTVRTRFVMMGSRDGAQWDTLADLSRETRDRANAYLELPRPARVRYVRYVHGQVAARHLAISDVRVFGSADGAPPPAPADVHAVRQDAGRAMTVRWTPVPGAVGYNVRWGISPGKLYETYQVWADTAPSVEIRALSAGQSYVVAVEAFNESGVSPLGQVVPVLRGTNAQRPGVP